MGDQHSSMAMISTIPESIISARHFLLQLSHYIPKDILQHSCTSISQTDAQFSNDSLILEKLKWGHGSLLVNRRESPRFGPFPSLIGKKNRLGADSGSSESSEFPREKTFLSHKSVCLLLDSDIEDSSMSDFCRVRLP